MSVAAPRHRDGCRLAALLLVLHSSCARTRGAGAAPGSSAMRTLVSRIVFHMKGARRASICSSMSGDIGVDAVDPAEHVRGQELVRVGEMPVECSAQLILLFALPG